MVGPRHNGKWFRASVREIDRADGWIEVYVPELAKRERLGVDSERIAQVCIQLPYRGLGQ